MKKAAVLTVLFLLIANASLIRTRTLLSDIQVLHSLKADIDPNSIPPLSYLSTWDFKLDPCESSGANFLGILCNLPDKETESSRVTTIELDGAQYDGFLTKDIGNLSELTTLSLRRNKFRGPIPESIPRLEKLKTLDLTENVFTGSILDEMSQLKRLQVIHLSHNKLTGEIPSWILSLRGQLVSLRLSNNEFSGRIPNFSGLWQLNTLDLSNNQFYGSLPLLPISLRTLSLAGNILSGRLNSIGRLQNLKILDLSNNRFAGTLPRGVLALPDLNHINVSVNWLTTIEVAKFTGQSTQLQSLSLQHNRLRGRLPANLVTIANLTSVNLAWNQFSGRIPNEYGVKIQSESWRTLYLDHNFLVGSLPPILNATRLLRVRGSLEMNCLKCPPNISLCRGGQRPASECVGQAADSNSDQ